MGYPNLVMKEGDEGFNRYFTTRAVAAGEDMDAYLVREGPGRPRREKKRWVPVAKKKKPPPAAEGKS